MQDRKPENKQKLVDFIVKANFPEGTPHREVQEAVQSELGMEYGTNYVGIVRNEIKKGMVKPSNGVRPGQPWKQTAERPAAVPTADPNPPKPRMDRPPTMLPRISATPADRTPEANPAPATEPATAKVMVEPQQVFSQIKAVKQAIAACGGEENLKKMIELMKEHGI